jgi:hypothetical protein
MKVTYIKNVGTDHAAVEKGGKVKKEGKNIPVLKGLPADHVGGHGKKKKPADRPGDGDKDAYPVGPGHLFGVFENDPVGLQGKIPGKYAVTVKTNRLIGTKGTGDKQDEGQKADKGNNGNNDPSGDIKDLHAGGSSDPVVYLGAHLSSKGC